MNPIRLLRAGPTSPNSASTPLPSPFPVERIRASELLAWRAKLRRLGGEPAGLDWLLEAAGGLRRAQLQLLRLHPQRPVDLPCPLEELERLWRLHLCESVPLQYLVGHCSWRNFEIAVGPAVLIPRPETEQVIDLALGLLKERKVLDTKRRDLSLWADLGTGSGCLAMGLAEGLPGSHGLAVDICPAALEQAHHNLQSSGLANQVSLVQGDWFTAVEAWWGTLELVVANPPYIPSDTLPHLAPAVRDHEPLLALDGGFDGLSAIRKLIGQAARALASGGLLVLEHHHDQKEPVLALLDSHGLMDCRSHQDLDGHWRFASATTP